MYTISIDLGGTYVKTGILLNKEILVSGRIPVVNNRDFFSILPKITEEVNRLFSEANIDASELAGIAVAFPGVVDSERMKVILTHKYPDATEFNFSKWAFDNWKVPMILINDARMAGIGEWRMGAGRKSKNMAMLTLGTGIGSFAVVDGHMLKGNKFRAGNISGHLTIDYKGEICQCGNVGCAESLASTWYLPQLIENEPELKILSKKGETLSFKGLFDLYQEKHPAAIRVANHCMDVWSSLAVNMIHAYDPEILVFGGGIMNSAETIIPYIKERVEKYSWIKTDEVSLQHAQLGENASIIGGYCLVEDLLNS